MTKYIEAKTISDVVISHTEKQKEKLLTITDGHGDLQHYMVPPDVLGLVLEQGLRHAAQWSEDPNLAIHELTGPSRHLPVSHVSVSMAPDNREMLLNLFVGQVQMSYLISIDALMNGLQPLLSTLDWSGVHEIKPN